MKSITIISTNTTCFKPWIPCNSKVLLLCPKTCSRKPTTATTTVRASLQDSQPPNTSQQQQQLNLSVLRFTLGHPTHPSPLLFSNTHSHVSHSHVCACLFVAFHSLIGMVFFFFYIASGIPGLDESYLPRWIGYGFASLLLLNHFLGSDSATVTPAQLVRNYFF